MNPRVRDREVSPALYAFSFFVFAAFSLVVDLRVSAMLVSNWHLIVSWRNGDPA
jgi:hypothetical protein